MSHRVTVVRCPKCGSTNAGEIGGVYEFTQMRCAECGHQELCDEYQIKDNWNTELPPGCTSLPAVVPISPRAPQAAEEDRRDDSDESFWYD